MFGLVVGRNGQWNFSNQDNPLFGNLAVNAQTSAESGDAFFHADKPEAARARCGDTAAIVGNNDAQRPAFRPPRAQFYS
jgi:hypothetical protein